MPSLASQLPLGVRICDGLLFPDAMAALTRIQSMKLHAAQDARQQQQHGSHSASGTGHRYAAFYTKSDDSKQPLRSDSGPSSAAVPAAAPAAPPPHSRPRTLVAAASVVVGEKVTVLASPECKSAVLAAGMKFNPARKKRCGTAGVVLSVENFGPQLIKAKVTFQDKAKDPVTGAVLRVDTANMVFPVGALANDPEMTEGDRARAAAEMAATAAGITPPLVDVESTRVNSEKEEAEEAARQARIEAEDDELAKATEAARARAAMEAAEARAAMEAAEAKLDAAAEAEANPHQQREVQKEHHEAI